MTQVLPAKYTCIQAHEQAKAKRTPGDAMYAIARNRVKGYRRHIHLPKVLGLWPGELEDFSELGTRRIVARLLKKARKMRRAGEAGHWSYDCNDHQAVITAWMAEREHLEAMKAARQDRKEMA